MFLVFSKIDLKSLGNLFSKDTVPYFLGLFSRKKCLNYAVHVDKISKNTLCKILNPRKNSEFTKSESKSGCSHMQCFLFVE